jgi:hypothetical protein
VRAAVDTLAVCENLMNVTFAVAHADDFARGAQIAVCFFRARPSVEPASAFVGVGAYGAEAVTSRRPEQSSVVVSLSRSTGVEVGMEFGIFISPLTLKVLKNPTISINASGVDSKKVKMRGLTTTKKSSKKPLDNASNFPKLPHNATRPFTLLVASERLGGARAWGR